MSPADVGLRIAQLREHAGLSQGQLARLAGVSRPYITQIENGKKQPSDAVLHRLASALGLSPVVMRAVGDQASETEMRRLELMVKVMQKLQGLLDPEDLAVLTDLGQVAVETSPMLAEYAIPPQESAPFVPPPAGWDKLGRKDRRMIQALIERLVTGSLEQEEDGNGDHQA